MIPSPKQWKLWNLRPARDIPAAPPGCPLDVCKGRQIKRGSHHTVAQLEGAIREFIQTHNENPRPFQWIKTADQILANVRRFACKTLEVYAD